MLRRVTGTGTTTGKPLVAVEFSCHTGAQHGVTQDQAQVEDGTRWGDEEGAEADEARKRRYQERKGKDGGVSSSERWRKSG